MMDELIAKLEAATEPSPELDARIAVVFGILDDLPSCSRPEAFLPEVEVFYRVSSDMRRAELWTRHEGKERCQASRSPAAYTSSIDAALTLVPEGWGWRIEQVGNGPSRAIVGGHIPRPWLDCATPAIALCVAALRARVSA